MIFWARAFWCMAVKLLGGKYHELYNGNSSTRLYYSSCYVSCESCNRNRCILFLSWLWLLLKRKMYIVIERWIRLVSSCPARPTKQNTTRQDTRWREGPSATFRWDFCWVFITHLLYHCYKHALYGNMLYFRSWVFLSIFDKWNVANVWACYLLRALWIFRLCSIQKWQSRVSFVNPVQVSNRESFVFFSNEFFSGSNRKAVVRPRLYRVPAPYLFRALWLQD